MLHRRIKAGMYSAIRDESDRRRPFQILLESLPVDVQKQYQANCAGAVVACSIPAQIAPPVQLSLAVNAGPDTRYRELWAWYEKLSVVSKQQAITALAVVVDFHEASDAGVSVGMATAAVIAKHGISEATLWRYRNDVAGHPRGYWLPLLAPNYCGNGKEAEFDDEAWDWIRSRHMTQTQIKTAVLVRMARQEGASKGWKIPSTKTVDRRLKRESAGLTILGRQGPKALEASFPTVEKDWASVPLHEMWESDGCRLNLFARWPDGTIGRPFIVTWRECRSRLVLSCKGYLNPCGELVMAALQEAIVHCGYKPKRGKMDNGREYANKAFSGGQKTRYRFKVIPGEPIGVMTQMGITAEWSKPGRGRDKPIESWHRMLHEHVDQLPEFAGAYCGKDALSKPEDFDPKNAVPIELVNAALGRFLHWFNTQHKHRGDGMNGRTPQAVYEELLPSIDKAEHTADAAHLRLLLMAVKTLTPDKGEATFRLKLNGYGERRYWSREFAQLPLLAWRKKYHVWYHPQNPDLPIAIYDGDTYICDCNPIDRIPAVGSGEAAGAHVKAKNALMRPVKAELKAIKEASPVKLPSFAAAGQLIDARPSTPPQPQPAVTSISPERREELKTLRETRRKQNLPEWLRVKSA